MRKTVFLGLYLFTLLVLTACIRKADLPSKVKPIPSAHKATMYLASPSTDTVPNATTVDHSSADSAK